MSEKRKVFVAEENPEIIEYLRNFLTFLGEFELKQVSTPVELLAGVNAVKPDLVVLDLNSLKVTSRQIFSEIKKSHASVKILAITARQGEEKVLMSQGAHAVAMKPVDFTDLSEKIKKLLHAGEESQPEYARLLIADDEVELSGCLKEIFERVGIEVCIAGDGEEALQVFREKACQLVLLDIKMPKMSGVEVIEQLQKSENPPPPKAIFIMTAGLAERLSEFARHDYPVLDKPLDLESLKERLLAACEKHGLSLKEQQPK